MGMRGITCCHTPGMQSSIKPPANRGQKNLCRPFDRTSQRAPQLPLCSASHPQPDAATPVTLAPFFTALLGALPFHPATPPHVPPRARRTPLPAPVSAAPPCSAPSSPQSPSPPPPSPPLLMNSLYLLRSPNVSHPDVVARLGSH